MHRYTLTQLEQPPAIMDRYLQLVQEVLINSIYQDRATDPRSHPFFDAPKRDAGLDWPQQALNMIGSIRLRSLPERWELVLRDSVPGDFVETGIWRGGACTMIAAVLAVYGEKERKVRGFDSFQGLPPPNEEIYPGDRGDQLHRFSQQVVSLGEVPDNFRRLGLWIEQVRLVKGWFKDTVAAAPIKKTPVLIAR
jgi:O-methyltransferase